MTFSLLHATDFADRLLYKIIPPLKAGMIVLADRYAYTAFARDVARGVDRNGSATCTASPCSPIWRCISACRSTSRSTGCWPGASSSSSTRPAWTWAGARMPTESFRLFQSKVLDEYDQLVPEFGLDGDRRRGQHHRAAAGLSRSSCRPNWSRSHDARQDADNQRRARRRHAGPLLRPRPAVPVDRRLSRQDHRHRGHGRRGPLDADPAAARVARGAAATASSRPAGRGRR